MSGHIEVVRLLLDRSADVNFLTLTGNTALQAACENGHESVVKVLLDCTANVHTGPHDSSMYRHPPVAQLLLDHGATKPDGSAERPLANKQVHTEVGGAAEDEAIAIDTCGAAVVEAATGSSATTEAAEGESLSNAALVGAATTQGARTDTDVANASEADKTSLLAKGVTKETAIETVVAEAALDEVGGAAEDEAIDVDTCGAAVVEAATRSCATTEAAEGESLSNAPL